MINHTARGLIALSFLLCATPALACSVLGPQPHAVIEASDDSTPPATPQLQAMTIDRGKGPRGGMSTSCDDIGFLTFDLVTEDDTSASDAIGYQLTLVSGELPFELPTEAVRPQSLTNLTFTWIDGATREQEPMDATAEISAIDEAGNVSAPLTVVIDDPGHGGCASLPHAGVWALLGVLAVRRRAVRDLQEVEPAEAPR
jgi:hypothetical protein